jgi:hypothetical protein
VAINGDYTDSVGRAATALRLGEEWPVIDPTSGQLLVRIDDEPGVLGPTRSSTPTPTRDRRRPANRDLKQGAEAGRDMPYALLAWFLHSR